MKSHRLLYFPIAILFLLSFVDCAKRGNPSGGPKDSIPPVIVRSVPENYSTLFDDNEIRIYFDEFIKLKDISKELIISPPLKYSPTITPLTSGKFIKIKILDTLLPNTTYSFNFGKSIVDNNEENPFEYFKYVLSTGDYIDSLKLGGTIKDALLVQPEIPSTIMLYEIDEDFNDSVIFSEKPRYITAVSDSTSSFEFTNIKEGNYLLIGLREKTNDYIYQPELDKIGFVNRVIKIPTEETFELTLFKEEPEYAVEKPKHESKNHILFGFKGDYNEVAIEELFDRPNDFERKALFDIETDTIHYWFKPEIELDTLDFNIHNGSYTDSVLVRVKDLYSDTLQIKPLKSGTILIRDTLKYHANTPLVSIVDEMISILDIDSVAIPLSSYLDPKYNIANIIFEKSESESYRVQLLPGALNDFFEETNDTINTLVSTRANSDYGTLNIQLENASDFPLIVQLVDSRFKVIAEEWIESNSPVFFDYISPGNYYIRLIFDENSNKIWDSGNFLERNQPEKIIYYPSLLDIRANWSLKETFILD
jgi:hypothetical protein